MISRRGLVAGALILVVAAMPALLAGTRYANYVEHLIASAMLLGLYAMAWDFLYRITEPLLRPIRNLMPNLGGIDISPVILILLIILLENIIIYYVRPNVF